MVIYVNDIREMEALKLFSKLLQISSHFGKFLSK